MTVPDLSVKVLAICRQNYVEDVYKADWWPWDLETLVLEPDDRIRELVKAGALIAAEIDRLQRKGAE